MYCSQCGKENEAGNAFCSYCGAKLPEVSKPDAHRTDLRKADLYKVNLHSETSALWMGLKPTDIIIGLLFILLAIFWIHAGVSGFGNLKGNFRFMADSAMPVSVILYLIPGIAAVILSVLGCRMLLDGQRHISVPIFYIGLAVIIKIGRLLFHTYTTKTSRLLVFYLFLNYGKVFGRTVIITLIIIAAIIAKNNQIRRGDE